MSSDPSITTFSGATPGALLDLFADEFAASLELLTSFRLDENDGAEVVEELPRYGDGDTVAVRLAVKGDFGVRVAYVQMPLPSALVIAGSLLMLPTADLLMATERDAPDSGEKHALMQVGHLVGAAFEALVQAKAGENTVSSFLGCQGVAAGEAPWVPDYDGAPYAIRKQMVAFEGVEPFEILIAIPV